MPAKTKRIHHKGHHKEKHTKKFVKVYAPYLPLIIIVGLGLFISTTGTFKKTNDVLAYAIDTTDSGLLESTNKEREANGAKALKYNVVLDKAAQEKAEDMAKRNYWSHNTPEGLEPWVFFDQAGYKYYKAAENLAYGFEDSEATVVGWMNSPSHRANLLDNELSEVGFGIVNVENYQNKGPETIVVALYGSPTTTQLAVSPIGKPADSGALFANTNATTEPTKISYAQMITGGSAPWITFAIGLIIGLGIMYLVTKHTKNFVNALRNGEKFILHHPLFDATIIALVALATVVAQTAGVVH